MLIPIEVDGFNLHLTDHCIERFMERTGCKSNDKATKTIIKLLSNVEDREYVKPFKRKNYISSLINHDFKDAIYVRVNEFIFVIEEGNVVKTVYFASKDQWAKTNTPIFKLW